MDPVTQGALGAAAAQVALSSRLGRKAWWLGALGGMAADLDIFIRSASDPLLGIEYHRHFTHSLSFVPVGGLLVALPWILRARHRAQWRAILAATTIGYATHGLLDAFTSYGTLLWWPLSRARVAWNVIGIVDLGFTVPLLVGVVLAARRGRARPAAWGLAIACLYMALCGVQRARARAAQERVLAARGHQATRAELFPTVFQNVTWRSLYEVDGVLHADKLRVPWFAAPTVTPGETAEAVDIDALAESLQGDPASLRALRTLEWFSSGWVGRSPSTPRMLGDVRYGLDPGGMRVMWGVRLGAASGEPARWVMDRASRSEIKARDVWTILFEDGPRARTIQ